MTNSTEASPTFFLAPWMDSSKTSYQLNCRYLENIGSISQDLE